MCLHVYPCWMCWWQNQAWMASIGWFIFPRHLHHHPSALLRWTHPPGNKVWKCASALVHVEMTNFCAARPVGTCRMWVEKGGGCWREGGFVKATSVDLDPLCDVKCIRFVSKVVKVLKWWCASAARCHYRRESAAAMQFSTVVGRKLAGRIAFTLERVFRRDHFPCSGFYYYWRDYFLIECICTINWLLLTFKSA